MHEATARLVDSGCRDRFIRTIGLKAFRRPLTNSEVKGYAALFTQAASGQSDFFAGAKLVVEAMLQSPNFLFHLEGGRDLRSQQYRIASRLSYFVLRKPGSSGARKTSERSRAA